ncbi:CU044_2847 family protein [Streptomyces toxytricini]|uniref:CU044_2847 family protein n=1 Tax=Streptomyces toxytricini TaxID=67369 RepID=A0ABW8ETK5_STRT5
MADRSQLMWVPLEEGGEQVVVEVEPASSGIVRAARPGEIAGTAARTLTESFEQVRAAAAILLDRMTALPRPPSSVEVELGVKLNAEAGAVIAKTAAEGNFVVRLTWEREEPGGPEQAAGGPDGSGGRSTAGDSGGAV